VIIAVFAKQIPSPDLTPALDPTTKFLDRPGPLVLDDSDAVGVEMALQLADQLGDAEVVLVSMAPNQENSGLRTGLAMGATSAVLVSDPGLAGSDALATAKVLAAAVKRIGADLVIAATESTDGYTGTVPAQVAELLGLPVVSFAKKVELADSLLRIERQTESGYDEIECPLPAVVSVTAGAVEPRYPLLEGASFRPNRSESR
jgi:electron transfer flavoprotein beta subunit